MIVYNFNENIFLDLNVKMDVLRLITKERNGERWVIYNQGVVRSEGIDRPITCVDIQKIYHGLLSRDLVACPNIFTKTCELHIKEGKEGKEGKVECKSFMKVMDRVFYNLDEEIQRVERLAKMCEL